MKKVTRNNVYVLLVFFLLQISCGKNAAVSNKKDPAEDATLALEDGNPEKAISILEDALKDDADNYKLTSILASAYAQKAGIDPLSFALKLADQGSKTDSSSSSSSSSSLGFDSKAIAITTR